MRCVRFLPKKLQPRPRTQRQRWLSCKMTLETYWRVSAKLMSFESNWFDMVSISRFDRASRKVPWGLLLLDGSLWGRSWQAGETSGEACRCSPTKCASGQTEAHANDEEHKAKRDQKSCQHHRRRRGEAEDGQRQEGNVQEGSVQGPGCLPETTFSTSWTGDSVSSSEEMDFLFFFCHDHPRYDVECW